MVYKCYIGHCEVIGKGEAYISSTIEFHLFKYFLEEESWLSLEGRQFLPTWLCSWLNNSVMWPLLCEKWRWVLLWERAGRTTFFPGWKPHTSFWISWLGREEGVGPCWDYGVHGSISMPPPRPSCISMALDPVVQIQPPLLWEVQVRSSESELEGYQQGLGPLPMLAHTAIGVGGRQEREW